MGLGQLIGRYAVDDSDAHNSMFAAACIYSALSAIIAAAVYLYFVRNYATDVLGPVGGLAFIVVSVGVSLSPLVDVRQMARRNWGMLLGRSLVVFAMRLLLLGGILWIHPGPLLPVLLFLGALLPDTVTGYAGALLLGFRGVRQMVAARHLPGFVSAVRYSLVNYLSVLLVQGPVIFTPVIVLWSVAANEYAQFFVLWGAFSLFLLMPQAITSTLHVEGRRDESDLAQQVKVIHRIVVLGGVLSLIAAIALGRLIPVLYGDEYRKSGSLLPWYAASIVPWGLVLLNLIVARIEEDLTNILRLSGFFFIVWLFVTIYFTRLIGIEGPAVGWFVSTTIAAVGSFVLDKNLTSVNRRSI
jgi:hypothetical protein